MPRNPLAYLLDAIESCDAIEAALNGVDLGIYQSKRLIRSAVEREFIIIGEAVSSLTRLDPETAQHISHARMIVGFRNQLAHDYAAIDDATVWAIATHDVSKLKDECQTLMKKLEEAG